MLIRQPLELRGGADHQVAAAVQQTSCQARFAQNLEHPVGRISLGDSSQIENHARDAKPSRPLFGKEAQVMRADARKGRGKLSGGGHRLPEAGDAPQAGKGPERHVEGTVGVVEERLPMVQHPEQIFRKLEPDSRPGTFGKAAQFARVLVVTEYEIQPVGLRKGGQGPFCAFSRSSSSIVITNLVPMQSLSKT